MRRQESEKTKTKNKKKLTSKKNNEHMASKIKGHRQNDVKMKGFPICYTLSLFKFGRFY